MIDTSTTLDLDWPTTDQTVMSPPPVSVPTIGNTFGVDSARTRKSDPVSSHRGGDVSAPTRLLVQDAVMDLFYAVNRPLTGAEVNERYRAHRELYGWPDVHHETPRKRTEELAAAGLLVILNPDDPRGRPRVYALPATTKEKAA